MLDPKQSRFQRRSGWPTMRLTHWFLGAAVATALVVQTGPASVSGSVPAEDVKPVASPTGCAVDSLLRPTCGKTLSGVYVRPRHSESRSVALRNFENLTGHKTQIVHHFYKGDRLFPNTQEKASLTQDGAQRLLLANWKVAIGSNWAKVARGDKDARIIKQARHMRENFPTKFFLAIHHEPENEVNQTAGSGYTAKDYAAMQRRVIDVLRRNGATNFVPVLNLMGSQKWADKPWFSDLYPGDNYVGWFGFDSYVAKDLGLQEGYFPEMMGRHYGRSSWRGAYDWATKNYPGKPIMLAEWGVGEKPGDSAYKGKFFSSAGSTIKDYPALKALVYFNNHDAFRAGDVRVNTTTAGLNGYKSMLRSFATGSSTAQATASEPPPPSSSSSSSSVSFVGRDQTSGNTTAPRVRIPAGVQVGDQLLLFGTYGVRGGAPAAPAGWTRLNTVANGTLEGVVWGKRAVAGDAGSTVSTPTPLMKSSLSVAAYRGVASTGGIAEVKSAGDSDTATHVSPSATAPAGGRVVQVWTDKSSGTTSWTPPSGVTVRGTVFGAKGGGRASALLVDSGAPVSAGSSGSQTARTNAVSGKGIAWTLTLKAAP